MSTSKVSGVKGRLDKINLQFSELIELATTATPDKAAIKNKYGALKVKLRADRDKFNLLKTKETATEDELCFYYPAVVEATSALTIAIGGKINQKFIDTLYDAQDLIEDYLDQL